MARRYICPIRDCVKVATYLGKSAEELFGPNLDPPDYTRLLGVQRNILVECPEHGRRFIIQQGHHISTPGPFKGITIKRPKRK